ncbi:MAG: DUF4440 domain-containing protein [Burkholderiales bacterium PBB4]|nr:MAG: DUF4440 domain-containing protein [Burkholderiales bacterium PBB4]
MTKDLSLFDTLRDLEVLLLAPEVRRQAEQLELLLHPGFREFGRSGAHYARQGIVLSLSHASVQPDIWSQDFSMELLSEGVALLTYKSAHQDASGQLERHTLRSSIWQHTAVGWQMRFHQGTPCAPFAKADPLSK